MAGVPRSGTSGPSDSPPPFDCEGRAKQLREQFRATGGTPELDERWADLRYQCALDELEIDGLDGDQPPSKRPHPSPEEDVAEEYGVDSNAGTTSWPGEVGVFLVVLLAPQVIIPALVKVFAADKKGPSKEPPPPPPPAKLPEGLGELMREEGLTTPFVVDEPGSVPAPNEEDKGFWPTPGTAGGGTVVPPPPKKEE